MQQIFSCYQRFMLWLCYGYEPIYGWTFTWASAYVIWEGAYAQETLFVKKYSTQYFILEVTGYVIVTTKLWQK